MTDPVAATGDWHTFPVLWEHWNSSTTPYKRED